MTVSERTSSHRLLRRISPGGVGAAIVAVFAICTLSATVAHAGAGVWTSGGPYGGYTSALAINPSTPTTLYAGMYAGGVFKSTDAGGTWIAANTGLPNPIVYALAIDPSNPATLYIGTDHNGIFKSTDSGGTWAPASTGLPDQEVFALAIDPANPSTLYAGMGYAPMRYGVFKSTDSGATWAAASTGLSEQVNALAINPSTPSTLYAGTDRGVFESTDAGATWTKSSAGLTNEDVLALAIEPSAPVTLYAGTNGGGIFKSTNSGGTWTAVNTGLATLNVKALVTSPATPGTLFAGTFTETMGGGVFRSTDAGATWAAASTNLTDLAVIAIAISPADSAKLFAGTYGEGVFRSSNSGGTWTVASTGLTTLPVSVLAIDPVTPSTLYAGVWSFFGGGIFKSIDSGATWTTANTGLPYPSVFVSALAVNPSTPSTLFAGMFFFGGIFRSTDAGATWAEADTGLGAATVMALAINPSTPATLYAGTNRGVFKSTDSGGTWTAANNGLQGASVNALAINPLNPGTLYAGASNGSVFKTTDSGGTWTATGAGLLGSEVYALAINPSAPATLYAGTDSGVFKSTNSGDYWTRASIGLTSTNVVELVVNSATPATLYAGTDDGEVFRSDDSGGTWAAIGTGLPGPSSLPVTALAIDPTGGTALYVGLMFGSVWQSTPPPAGSPGSLGFVPIVLDVVGLAHYTSELQLTNLGADSTTVKLSYAGSIGSGSGDVQETIPAGQQVVFPDAISHLRSKGVPIPTSGNQGGPLLLSAPAAGVRATVRTSADTVAPQPVGRAGLAYTDIDPASSSATKLYVYGLRTNDADRSNLAVYNMGQDSVSLKVTLVSGDDGRTFDVTAGVPLSLPAYGWYQYGDALLLKAAGFSSGYAIVERVTGSGPFGAYGVVNDQKTNDGSFIPALFGTQSGSRLTLPVLVETSAFESELILTNRGSATETFTLRYVESLSPAKGAGGTTSVEVGAGRQRIIPNAIDFLRSKGVAIGARGEASYAGSLQLQVSGVGLENVFAGARTSSISAAGGQFGLFYPAFDSSQEASGQAFILGLKADAFNRSNVAVIHTGAEGPGPITLELQVLDGSEGGKPAGQPLSVTLNPGEWAQPSRFFANARVPNGYVRIRRTAGTAPWYAYGVINDGGNPGERTGDGAYVPGVK